MTGEDLKNGRLRRKWTQQQTAKRLHVSQAYLSLLEQNRRTIPRKLVPKLLRTFDVPPTALPVSLPNDVPDPARRLADDLGALGYPPFAYLRTGRKRNPAALLLYALMQQDLEARVAEALPWLALEYSDMDWVWLVRNAKLRDLQNRLGFVVTLARRMAQKQKREPEQSRLLQIEQMLEPSRLAREDTFCHDSLSQAERRWLRERRSAEAQHWNLLTDLSAEQLSWDLIAK